MDAEGWYSATPEAIAPCSTPAPCPPVSLLTLSPGRRQLQPVRRQARAAGRLLVSRTLLSPANAGVSFSCRGCYVVAVEINPRKVELVRDNARIYGVEHLIEFVVSDFFHLAVSHLT